MLKEEEKKRCREIAEYYLTTGAGQRQIAKVFYISKTSVGKYLKYYLPKVDPELYQKVAPILMQRKPKVKSKTTLTVEIAKYFLDTKASQKEIAKRFNISATGVSMHLNHYLPNIDMELYQRVQEILSKRRREEEEIKELSIEVANYYLKTGKSQEKIGKEFGISESTVSKYLNIDLKDADIELYQKVQQKRKEQRKIK